MKNLTKNLYFLENTEEYRKIALRTHQSAFGKTKLELHQQ